MIIHFVHKFSAKFLPIAGIFRLNAKYYNLLRALVEPLCHTDYLQQVLFVKRIMGKGFYAYCLVGSKFFNLPRLNTHICTVNNNGFTSALKNMQNIHAACTGIK